MSAVSNAFENFIFKSFNIWGRATRLEFWMVMPVIWAAILGFLILDLQDIWSQLQAYQKPSLNPLSYASLQFFVLTWPARIAVTVRRLHDSGRSGKWAIAPYKAAVLAFWFVIGITTAAMTSGAASFSEEGVAMFGLGAIMAASGNFWPFMFALAQSVDLWSVFEGIRQVAGEIGGNVSVPDPVTLAEGYASDFNTTPAAVLPMVMVAFLLTFGPIILIGLWLFFLLMPGNPDHNRFGDPSGQSMKPRGSKNRGHNPMAGYGMLSHQAKATATDPEQRKAAVSSLYKERVLGQGGASSRGSTA